VLLVRFVVALAADTEVHVMDGARRGAQDGILVRLSALELLPAVSKLAQARLVERIVVGLCRLGGEVVQSFIVEGFAPELVEVIAGRRFAATRGLALADGCGQPSKVAALVERPAIPRPSAGNILGRGASRTGERDEHHDETANRDAQQPRRLQRVCQA
jgi:hypothetical protein